MEHSIHVTRLRYNVLLFVDLGWLILYLAFYGLPIKYIPFIYLKIGGVIVLLSMKPWVI